MKAVHSVADPLVRHTWSSQMWSLITQSATMFETTLIGVFLTGLFGGLHCAGMCGGIVTAMTYRVPVSSVTMHRRLAMANAGRAGYTGSHGCGGLLHPQYATQLLYNVGRISTYSLLGAAAGATGSLGWWLESALPLQQGAFLFTNVVLILMGLYVAGIKSIGNIAEAAGQRLWRRLLPAAVHQLKQPGGAGALAAGAVWGLVPCGMVYGVLLAALMSASAVQGAALMIVFGIGTLPGLLALGVVGAWFKQSSTRSVVRMSAGSLIVLFGVAGMLRLDAAQNLPLIGQICSQLPERFVVRLP